MAGSLADKCGRVKAVVFGCLWVVLGAALQASAYNITWMCFGRVLGKQSLSPFRHISRGLTYPVHLAGIGVGAIDCVIPVWSAEVSSHSARGAFLALEFVMVRFSSYFSSVLVRNNQFTGLEYRRFGDGLLDRIFCLPEPQ